ncbi:MAG: MFS transporter [Pseudonocardiales bacterium]|nr:MAG: MFS transporter [Pseudonocardiales bacterium]
MADVRSAATTAGAGLATAGRGVHRGTSAFWRFVRKGVDAQGARESGLSRLIDLHGVNGVGDALVAVGLAGTLFFSVPVGEARPRVALYLLVTMAPFALLAPVVGPMLDRFSHGRRYALATTMLARAFLAWIMAGSLHGLALYPAAFGVLVMSKAYSVARSAAVPRLLPPQVSLVAANSRLSLAAIICATVAAPIGIGLGQIGPQWPLRVATVAFLAAMVLALRLPATVDSDEGEAPVRLRSGRRRFLAPVQLGRPVVVALRSSAALRALSGFLTLFLAFLLRTSHSGANGGLALGAVVGAAALGSFTGTAIGARARLRHPHGLQLVMLALAAAGCVAAVVLPGLAPAIGLALVAGLSNSLAKLALDAVVQQGVAEDVRSSAFARSETVLQLAWVVGGGLGLIPFASRYGFLVPAVGLAAMVVWTTVSLRTVSPRRPQPVEVASQA